MKRIILLAVVLVVMVSIHLISFQPTTVGTLLNKRIKKENVSKVGKEQTKTKLQRLYNKSIPLFSPLDQDALLPMPTERLTKALVHHKRLISYLKDETYYTDDELTIDTDVLEQTLELLQAWNDADLNTNTIDTANDNNRSPKKLHLGDLFDTYLLKGRDRKGNVRFTGYYSPIVEVSSEYGGEYVHPIYAKPNEDNYPDGLLPTRWEILYRGVLAGKGLELAWAKSRKDVSLLQLQGSGFVKYQDGRTEYFSYGGHNGHTRRSMVAQTASMGSDNSTTMDSTEQVVYRKANYTFFQRSKRRSPIGAGGVPVTAEVTVAVDRRLVPLGACLLAEFPVIDAKGRLMHHEYKILLAQDTGGAIKGAGHMDYYTGIGNQALKKARYLSHYGRVWLLTPKQ